MAAFHDRSRPSVRAQALLILMLAVSVTAMDISHIPRIFRKDRPAPADMDEFLERPLKFFNTDLLPEQIRRKVTYDDESKPRHGPIKVFGGECQLEIIDKVDYNDYFDLVRGFFFALVEGPNYDVANCTSCNTIGKSVGTIQENVVAIFAARVLW